MNNSLEGWAARHSSQTLCLHPCLYHEDYRVPLRCRHRPHTPGTTPTLPASQIIPMEWSSHLAVERPGTTGERGAEEADPEEESASGTLQTRKCRWNPNCSCVTTTQRWWWAFSKSFKVEPLRPTHLWPWKERPVTPSLLPPQHSNKQYI